MTAPMKSLALLVAHLVLVGSVAGKYAWERHTCPRVWTRAAQYDPERPLRGRYLALTLQGDGCAASEPDGAAPALTQRLPCPYETRSEAVEFFIAEHARTPFPLRDGQELWAEVTVPPSGPPRPIRLAVADGKSLRVLDLR